MSRRIRMTATAAATAALLAPALAHAAPTIALDKACYLGSGGGTEPVRMTGSGFTPNAVVTIKRNDDTVAFPTADGAGNLLAEFNAPALFDADPDETTFTVTATEDAAPAQTASAVTKLSKFFVRIKPTRARPTSKVTIRARGFTSAKNLYAHYLYKKRFNSAPKKKKTVKLGRVKGDCGTLTRKVRQIPLKSIPTGIYPVQFDPFPVYKAHQIPFSRFEITVTRTFR